VITFSLVIKNARLLLVLFFKTHARTSRTNATIRPTIIPWNTARELKRVLTNPVIARFACKTT